MSIRELFWPLLGTWAGMEEQAASPWAPPASTRAMMTLKLDVSDTVVLQDYRQVRGDGSELTAHGVFRLEPGTEQVLWWWFDSYGEPPGPAAGGWSGDGLTLVRTTPQGRAEHRLRVVDEELGYEIHTRYADAPELSPFLTGTYRRLSGH